MKSKLDIPHITKVIETCLLTASDPLSIEQLTNIFDEDIESKILEEIILDLERKYEDSGIELIKVATGYRFRSKLEFQQYINKLYNIKPPKYSRATMETLAIIAYRQPITRGEIEELRGVALNGNVIQALFDRSWIEAIGHKQVPGKPELLATTTKFLDELGLTSLEELPALPEIDIAAIENSQDIIEEYDNNKEKNNG